MQSLDDVQNVDSYPALKGATQVIAITEDGRVGMLNMQTMIWQAVDANKVTMAQQQLSEAGIQLPQLWQ